METRVCANDPEHIETREGEAALGHDWGEWTVTTPATCTTEGVETRICNNDPEHIETRTIAIDPAAHNWSEWRVTSAATYWQEGEEIRTCLNDESHIERRAIAKLLKGDLDGDGKVTVSDALRALRIAAKLADETELALSIADIDRDGEITVADALQLLRVAAKLVTMEAWLE